MFTHSRLTTLLAMILGGDHTRNVYPQSRDNFTSNDFSKNHTRNVYPQSLNNFTGNDFGYNVQGTIPAMFTNSRLTTLLAMILGTMYHTRNVSRSC